ncbi:glycosyltransferase family 2 protein [Candidatus Uhrbacteria bacterium]|nr:glycosyltransferase family 2 protein [Candidatus Uhrbacteria bacterium]
MSDTPLISFITVNYKMCQLIRHLLQGIEDAHLPFSFEYLVVDNASNDGISEMVSKRFPWVTFISSPVNGGFGAGNNLGVRQAKGRYVVFLNPDLTIFPGEVEKWIAWMEQHPEVGISGPRIVNPDFLDQDSCYHFPKLLTPAYRRTFLGKLPWARQAMDHYLMRDMDRTVVQPVDWVLGAAMMVRRNLFEQIGMFDERFFMYFEDADLCRRAWMVGMQVMYTPAARVIHYHQRQSRTRYVWQAVTNPLTRIHIESGVKYFLKYYRKPHPRSL